MSTLAEIRRERVKIIREFARGEISHQTYFSIMQALETLEEWVEERERRRR